MTTDVRESIAANLDKRAAEHHRIGADSRLSDHLAEQDIAEWLRELAAEVRAGVL